MERGVIFGRTQQQLSRGIAPGIGERIKLGFTNLAGERRHTAQYFAEWRAIILRDPAAQRDELDFEYGFFVNQAEDFFHRAGGGIIVQLQDDAGELSRSERNQDAASGPHSMSQRFRQLVGEALIERHRQADIAIDHGAGR